MARKLEKGGCTLLSTSKRTPFAIRFISAVIPEKDSPKETPVTRRFSADFVTHQIEVNDYAIIENNLLESKIAAAKNDANTVSIDDSNESLVTITSTHKIGDIYSAIALHDPNQLTDKQRSSLTSVNDGNRTKRVWLGKMSEEGALKDDGTTESKRHRSFRYSTPLFKVEVEPTTKSDA